MRRLALLVALVGATSAAAYVALRPRRDVAGHERRMAAARRAHEALSRQLDPFLDRDPVVRQALATKGQVVLGMHRALVERLVAEVGQRYLHEVQLDLRLDKEVTADGEIEVGTPFGRVKAGRWTAVVTIERVSGTLVTSDPRVALGPGEAVGFQADLAVRNGRGQAKVRFRWNARRMAGLVCRDFTVERTLHGTLAPLSYPLAGEFRLERGDETVVATPRFPRRKIHIRPSLTRESWTAVALALDEQDRVLRCGLALDPEQVRGKLEALLAKGFDVQLPASLFRAVELPAAVVHEAQVEGRSVTVGAEATDLRIDPDAVWFGADVSSELEPVSASPAGSPR